MLLSLPSIRAREDRAVELAAIQEEELCGRKRRRAKSHPEAMAAAKRKEKKAKVNLTKICRSLLQTG